MSIQDLSPQEAIVAIISACVNMKTIWWLLFSGLDYWTDIFLVFTHFWLV